MLKYLLIWRANGIWLTSYTSLIFLYIMQNWELPHCGSFDCLILMLTFLLHISIKKRSLIINKLFLSLIAWACKYYNTEIGCLGHYLNSFQIKAFPIPEHHLIEQQQLQLLSLPREFSFPWATLLRLFNFCICPLWIWSLQSHVTEELYVIFDNWWFQNRSRRTKTWFLHNVTLWCFYEKMIFAVEFKCPLLSVAHIPNLMCGISEMIIWTFNSSFSSYWHWTKV